VGVLSALLLASDALLSPLIEDWSAATDLGSSLIVNAPWAGYADGNLRLIDLDADGVDEVLVGGRQTTCVSLVNQMSVFRVDSAAALGGGLGGGLGFLLILCACCCVLTIQGCCCALCLVVILAIVAVALVAIVSVAIGLFAAGDVGIVFFLVRGTKGKEDPLFDVEMDALDAAALRAEAERIDEYRVVNWSDIKPIRKLGEGAFGEVLLAEWNGVEVAVKIFKNATKEAAEDFKHEAVMMAKVAHHPHIVRFIGAAFKDGAIAMVLALCSGGSLISVLQKKKLDVAAKTRILRETASALSFLHSLGIVHRDIAARNVLLDGHGVAKLADLGMSRVLEDKQGEQTTANNVGPIRWMAPEAIRSKKYSAASDCFSFAILMVEVWSDGEVPYAHIASLVDVAMAVLNNNERPRIPEGTPLNQERLRLHLWDRDPTKRPTMADVVEQIGKATNAGSEWEAAASSDAITQGYEAIVVD
jgi:hypothetical protein